MDSSTQWQLEQDVGSQISVIIRQKNELVEEKKSLERRLNDTQRSINKLQNRQDALEKLCDLVHKGSFSKLLKDAQEE